jgi:hypothetical protein
MSCPAGRLRALSVAAPRRRIRAVGFTAPAARLTDRSSIRTVSDLPGAWPPARRSGDQGGPAAAGPTGAAAHRARRHLPAPGRQISDRDAASVAQTIQAPFTGLDGTRADGTVGLGPDGTQHEIDPDGGQARALPAALARHVSAARRAGAVPAGSPQRTRGAGERADRHRGPRAGHSAGQRRDGPGRVPAELGGQVHGRNRKPGSATIQVAGTLALRSHAC